MRLPLVLLAGLLAVSGSAAAEEYTFRATMNDDEAYVTVDTSNVSVTAGYNEGHVTVGPIAQTPPFPWVVVIVETDEPSVEAYVFGERVL